MRAAVDAPASGGHRIFRLPLASVYPLYVEKVGKKGRTTDELDAVICWLTGYDERELKRHIAEGTTLADFFGGARLNPNASLITGVICGVRVETIEDPIAALLQRDVELRILPTLGPLRDAVVASSLQFSVIRMPKASTTPSFELGQER